MWFTSHSINNLFFKLLEIRLICMKNSDQLFCCQTWLKTRLKAADSNSSGQKYQKLSFYFSESPFRVIIPVPEHVNENCNFQIYLQ